MYKYVIKWKKDGDYLAYWPYHINGSHWRKGLASAKIFDNSKILEEIIEDVSYWEDMIELIKIHPRNLCM